MISHEGQRRLDSLMTPQAITQAHASLLAARTRNIVISGEDDAFVHASRIERDKHEIMRTIAFSLEEIAGTLGALLTAVKETEQGQ